MADILGTSSRQIASKQCMALNVKCLRNFGLWPRAGDTTYWIFTVILLCNLNFHIGMFTVVYFEDHVQAHDLIENTANILTVFPSVVILTSVMLNKDRYEKVIMGMQSTFTYEGPGYNEERARFVGRLVREETKLVTGYFVSIWLAIYGYIFTPIIRRYLFEANTATASINLPLKMWSLSGRTEIEYMIQFAILCMVFTTTSSLDAFSFTLVKNAAHQFEVLNVLLEYVSQVAKGQELTTLEGHPGREWPTAISQAAEKRWKTGPSPGTSSSSKIDRTTDCRFETQRANVAACEDGLLEIVKLHQEILTNTQILADLLSPFLFTHFIVTSLTLCMVGYGISAADDMTQVLRGMVHMFALMFRVFMLSYFSSALASQSANVGHAAYSCRWFSCSESFKRTLSMIICRAQRPVVMRTGAFGVLSLETFATLLQGAYSYYTVLKNFT